MRNMDENYINLVRKSLNGCSNDKVRLNDKMPRKDKQIKFSMSMDRYNSENAFVNMSKSEKLKNRKSTPFKIKEKKSKGAILESTSFGQGKSSSQKLKNRIPTPFKKKLPKEKIVVSFSSSDSFEEDLRGNSLSPSKSELELFQNSFKKSAIRKSDEIFEISSESEENVADFNLDSYFDAHELSFNESITEAHSGIDYEFVTDDVSDVNILEEDLSVNGNCHQEERVGETIVLSDDVFEDNVIDNVEKSQENISAVNQSFESLEVFGDEDSNVPIQEANTGEESSVLRNSTKYYDLDDGKLVVIKENQSIVFHGLLSLRVVYGKVEVLGSILNTNSNRVNLYSPRGTALLYLKNITTAESNELLEITAVVPSLTDNDIMNEVFIESGCAVCHCTKLEDVRIPFIEKYISQQIFPKVDISNTLQAVFEPTDNLNFIKGSEIWDQVLDNVQPSTKLLVAGGKGVGKSTLLRFAINRLLNKFDKVRVIDLDPGQSEFSVPGCVSVVTVTEPIFGPNYTHLKVTNRSLLSNINVAHEPDAYIRCVQSLVAYSETLEECPTLINYMGFNHGMGIHLISSVITYIQPTDIVQIISKNPNKNFKVDLIPETVNENCNLFSSNSVTLSYNLQKIQAMNDENEGWTLEPRQVREMCVLSYLGQMMPRGINSLTSQHLTMYQIKLSSIKITNLQKEELSPAVANANLVALCALDDESDIFICLGYGVVRGIDIELDLLILLTPEKQTVLEDVYYLVIGSVNLPPSVYMTSDDIKGNIPYVMEGELVSFGQITRRSYLPSSVIKK